MFVLSLSDESLFCVFDWQLQEEVDGLADRMELANNALRGDWSHWKYSMRTDLKSAFISTAEKNVDYYEKVSSRVSAKCHLIVIGKISNCILKAIL